MSNVDASTRAALVIASNCETVFDSLFCWRVGPDMNVERRCFCDATFFALKETRNAKRFAFGSLRRGSILLLSLVSCVSERGEKNALCVGFSKCLNA